MAREIVAGQAASSIITASARSVVPAGLVTLRRRVAASSSLAASSAPEPATVYLVPGSGAEPHAILASPELLERLDALSRTRLALCESAFSRARYVGHGEAASEAGVRRMLGRLLMRRTSIVARAVRGSALLACGYTRLGGGIDGASRTDLAWGFS